MHYRGETAPGIHCLRMHAISQHSAAPRISPCDVRGMMTLIRIHGCIINCVRDIIIMATCVEDLDRSISYALQRLGCSATTLKPEHGVSAKSIYEGNRRFLAGFGKSLWIYMQ